MTKFLVSICVFLPFIFSNCLCRSLQDTIKSSFNVLNYGAIGNAKTDDSQAFLKAWADTCGANQGVPTLVIPKKIFMLEPIAFAGPCKSKSVHVLLQGKIVAPQSTESWSHTDKWISFTNVQGLIINGRGSIDGQGQSWWKLCPDEIMDLNAASSCSKRPSALHFSNCNGLQLSGLTHINSQRNHISINQCNGVNIFHLHIIAPADSPNTDGIDISESTHVNIHNSHIQTGDDCIAINTGSSFINITAVHCGPGHGISVGSLGRDGTHQTVEEVYVKGCTFKRTQNGARIKTFQGGSGYARKITFEDITLDRAENPIIIDQFYGDKDKKMTTLQVSDVTYRNINGSSADVQAITLNCIENMPCSNIIMDHIHITPSVPGKNIFASCDNANGKSTATTPSVQCLSRLET